ncbi:murein hydrolase activator EnvC family protein [Actinomadura kijaniata]|uniref:murein hydrolase activator EnvC family protein n=1 Tax=Actinomadura kijaniata TaxID=46161 RepID=UPI000B26C5F2|nr:M23 family metallopeptidase [Actinomadura kijaniata]
MSVFVTVLIGTVVLTLPPPSSEGEWRWPLTPVPEVLRAFSPPPAPWLAGHRGVDLAARPGQAVLAAGPGRVSYAGRLAGRGVVAITHGVLRTTYLPVRPSVKRGSMIASGARIGVVEGTPRHCAASCLHWGLLDASGYRDPLALVRPQVRLLPRWPGSRARPSAEKAPPEPPLRLGLRDASTATGGALTGVLLTSALVFARRRTRPGPPRRPPTGVIDLERERRLRRAR